MPTHKGSRGNFLIKSPYQNWKDAQSDLGKHSTLEYHKDAMARMKASLGSMKDSKTRIDHRLSWNASVTIDQNRSFLKSILRAIEYCGRQGIALRGLRDDGAINNDTDNQGTSKNSCVWCVKLMKPCEPTLRRANKMQATFRRQLKINFLTVSGITSRVNSSTKWRNKRVDPTTVWWQMRAARNCGFVTQRIVFPLRSS